MNKNDYIIRLETEKDFREVENLAREAFWNLSVPGCDEHFFIHVMRKHMVMLSQSFLWVHFAFTLTFSVWDTVKHFLNTLFQS